MNQKMSGEAASSGGRGTRVGGRWVALAVVALTTSAWAQPVEPPDPGVRKERQERRMRLSLMLGLSEALELSEAETLKLAEKVRGFEEKRRPLREEMGAAMKVLHQAAMGESSAFSQVDGALQKVLDGRAKLAALDQSMFQTLSQGLSPQKKAKLAVFFAEQARERGRGGKFGGRPRMGPRHERPFVP